jgi:hypothetical protein
MLGEPIGQRLGNGQEDRVHYEIDRGEGKNGEFQNAVHWDSPKNQVANHS